LNREGNEKTDRHTFGIPCASTRDDIPCEDITQNDSKKKGQGEKKKRKVTGLRLKRGNAGTWCTSMLKGTIRPDKARAAGGEYPKNLRKTIKKRLIREGEGGGEDLKSSTRGS